MSVSFGFKKKIENKVASAAEPKDERDYLNAVEGKVIQSSKPKEVPKGDLVIPLIQKNRYILPTCNKKAPENKSNVIDSLEAEAAKELIKESRNFMENVEQTGDENFDNLAIPLLLKNKVPDGFETDDRLDVSLRPDEATETQYDQVPVAAFGMAVLRGMGWTMEEGIGKTFKQNTKMLEQKMRPKGLGLGADVPSLPKSSENVSSSKTRIEGSDNEGSLALTKGANVFMHRGPQRNKYGTVIGIDIETARCIIKMAIGGKTEQAGLHSLKVVSKREFDRNAKDLSWLSKAYTGQSIQVIGNGKSGGRNEKARSSVEKRHGKESEPSKPDRKRKSSIEPDEKRRKESKENSSDKPEDPRMKHKKHKKQKTHRHDPGSVQTANEQTWLRPLMRARIIDKSYRKGRHYREKVTVEDVMGQGLCCCKTDDGKILDDIKDSMLETVIPKSSSDSYVIIVQSRKRKHNGKLAKILEKNKEKREALLQLIDDRDMVVRVNFEDMCEFAGDPEHNAMF